MTRTFWLTRCRTAVLGFMLGAGVLAPVPGQAASLSVTDDRGTAVTLLEAPRRVVSLLPSLTETVCDLGACARLVAVDRWSNWPAEVARLPRVGGLDDPNVEMIVAARPDLVLVAPASRLAARLRGLGLTVGEFDARDLAEARRVADRLAVLLGTPQRAAERWTALQSAIDKAVASVPAQAWGRRVYFEISSTPFAAGEASFIGELLSRLGARNVVPAALGPFPQISPEFVVRADPDLIVVPQAEAAALMRRPGWAGIRAVKSGQVCALSTAQVDLLVRPGPRLAQGAAVLAQCLSRGKAS